MFRVLASVTDKSGLPEFASELKQIFGSELMILSTGGTARLLRENGQAVIDVASFTGSPECMDGRVKTLHPKIFGGILARRDSPSDMSELTEVLRSAAIDLVAVNLYQFVQAARQPEVRFEDLIENIDIGGPSLIRAAAKNFQDVLVVVKPSDYPLVLEQLRQVGGPTRDFRFRLLRKAFIYTAIYDMVIAYVMEFGADPETGTISGLDLPEFIAECEKLFDIYNESEA